MRELRERSRTSEIHFEKSLPVLPFLASRRYNAGRQGEYVRRDSRTRLVRAELRLKKRLCYYIQVREVRGKNPEQGRERR